jgi:S1-C subfamily serine protease
MPLSILCLFSSCAGLSAPKSENGSPPVRADQIGKLVETEPARAFSLAFRESEKLGGGLGSEDAKATLAAAAKVLARRLADEAEGGDPLAALAAYDSLVRISETDGAKDYLSSGWKEGVTRDDLVEEIARRAEKAGNEVAARVLREGGIALSSGAEGTAAGASPGVHDFESMLKGVCTIYVDRGLRVEGNVAVPDRIIGTGFFIDGEGRLLTNYHVIESEVNPEYEGYSRLYIRLSGDKLERIPAKVLGWDRSLDLALLKAPVKPEYVFELGEGRAFKAGDRIYAIGSPVGLENTVTSGIVSATGRNVISLGDAIQVDVAVNPGNSGGPLADENGRLAGVVFAGLLQYQGLNFALPLRWVRAAIPGLYAGGEVSHAFLGICVSDDGEGVMVEFAIPSTGADDAGITAGERLVSINGRVFRNAVEARAYTMALSKGSLALVETRTEGGRKVRLVQALERPFLPLEPYVSKIPKERLFPPLFGMDVEKSNAESFAREFRITRVRKGGIADEAGLSEDDPIVLREWRYDKKFRFVIVQLYVKRQKQGFLETIMQLPVSIEAPVIL